MTPPRKEMCVEEGDAIMAGAIGRGGDVTYGREDVPPARQELATNGNPAVYWTSAGTIRGPLARPDADALAERSQVAVADPLPLGLAGFASATFTISAVFAGWFRLSDVVVAIPVALVFGGIVQFLAGMWAFRRGACWRPRPSAPSARSTPPGPSSNGWGWRTCCPTSPQVIPRSSPASTSS